MHAFKLMQEANISALPILGPSNVDAVQLEDEYILKVRKKQNFYLD